MLLKKHLLLLSMLKTVVRINIFVKLKYTFILKIYVFVNLMCIYLLSIIIYRFNIFVYTVKHYHYKNNNNAFIQQRHIQMTKSDSKDIYKITKDLYFR